MKDLFVCPPPTAIAQPAAITCPFNLNQTVKMALQRIQASAPFANEEAIQTQSNWTTLKAATDSTKIITTPFLTNFIIPPSEANKAGGNDNSTVFGMPRLNGGNHVTVTFEIHNAPNDVLATLRALSKESAIQAGFTNLSGYFFDEFGNVASNSNFSGIKIYNWFIGDNGSQGKNSPTMAMGSFDMEFGWSEGVIKTTPDFNILNI